MSRRTAWAAGLLALLAHGPLAACSASDEPASDEPGSDTTTTADACTGGDLRVLQGQPLDLPGGGSTGIGQIDMGDPPTVRLVLGGARPGETADDLRVGDTFAVQGAAYRVDCISPGKVTLEAVDG